VTNNDIEQVYDHRAPVGHGQHDNSWPVIVPHSTLLNTDPGDPFKQELHKEERVLRLE